MATNYAPQSSQPTNGAPPANKSRFPALLVTLLLVSTLVVAVVGAEFYVRNRVIGCFEQSLQEQLGSKIDVGLSAKPVLVQAIDKKVPSVTVDSAEPRFGPAIGMRLHAQLNDLDISGSDGGTVASSSADINWSEDGILQTLQSEPLAAMVTSVNADGPSGTLRLQVAGGMAELNVKPTIDNDRVTLTAINAEVLGLGVPTALVDAILQILTDSLGSYPLNMVATSLKVTDDALSVSLVGGHAALVEGDQANAKPVECSLV